MWKRLCLVLFFLVPSAIAYDTIVNTLYTTSDCNNITNIFTYAPGLCMSSDEGEGEGVVKFEFGCEGPLWNIYGGMESESCSGDPILDYAEVLGSGACVEVEGNWMTVETSTSPDDYIVHVENEVNEYYYASGACQKVEDMGVPVSFRFVADSDTVTFEWYSDSDSCSTTPNHTVTTTDSNVAGPMGNMTAFTSDSEACTGGACGCSATSTCDASSSLGTCDGDGFTAKPGNTSCAVCANDGTECCDVASCDQGSTGTPPNCGTCDATGFTGDSTWGSGAWSACECADGYTGATCTECTDMTFSTGGDACGPWTYPTPADCSAGEGWTTGSSSTDSSCTGVKTFSVTFTVAEEPSDEDIQAIKDQVVAEFNGTVAASQIDVSKTDVKAWALAVTITGLSSADATMAVVSMSNVTLVQSFLNDAGVSLTAEDVTVAASVVCEVANANTYSDSNICTVATCAAGFAPGDAVCGGCPAETFTDGTGACQAWTASCDAGNAWVGGTAALDATCTVCSSGTFSTGGVESTCTSWTAATADDCDDGETWTAGTTTADSKCEDPGDGSSSGATLWPVLALAVATLVARV